MESIISSPIGLIHTIVASIAVITGTIVLLNQKGTTFHKRVGYVYAISMLLMNISAFGIYQLFGGFGIFHILALVSLVALIGGMYPVLNRSKVKNWYTDHIRVMSWSIVGLYAAFAAEITVRFFPPQYFSLMVGLSSGLICFIGAIMIKKRVAKVTGEPNNLG